MPRTLEKELFEEGPPISRMTKQERAIAKDIRKSIQLSDAVVLDVTLKDL
jgi:hypothetical protein